MVNTNFSNFFQESTIQRVVIYAGNKRHEGVFYDCVGKTKDLFKDVQCPWEITEVTQEDFFPEKLVPKETLLIVPGAKASELDGQIGGKVPEIRQFVEDGGNYFGTCGGAYWASKKVSYQLSETETLEKIRALAFYNGIARGPLRVSGFGNDRPHAVAKVKWKTLPSPFPALLMGGGSFIDAEQTEGCEVLAEYLDVPSELKNAVVKSYTGKGVSILSGIHFEWQARDVNASDLGKHFPGHNWTLIKESLEEAENVRLQSFAYLLAEFERSPTTN